MSDRLKKIEEKILAQGIRPLAEFCGDTVQYIKKHKKTAAVFAATAGLMVADRAAYVGTGKNIEQHLHGRGDILVQVDPDGDGPLPGQNYRFSEKGILNGKSPFAEPETVLRMPDNFTNMPFSTEAENVHVPSHWDFGPLGAFKHAVQGRLGELGLTFSGHANTAPGRPGYEFVPNKQLKKEPEGMTPGQP